MRLAKESWQAMMMATQHKFREKELPKGKFPFSSFAQSQHHTSQKYTTQTDVKATLQQKAM